MIGCLLGIKDPMLLGLLGAMPLALLFIIFVSEDDVSHYSFNLGLGLLGYALATLTFWYLFTQTNLSKVGALGVSLLAWLLIVTALVCLSNRKIREKMKKYLV